MAKLIEITEEHYDELINDACKLLALQNAGVDNWSGYDDAVEVYEEAIKRIK